VRALLVEDEALVAIVAEEALTALGFQVEVAASVAEAMAAVGREQPHLAVIDLGLPDTDGGTLAAGIRAAAPEAGIVIATGYEADAILEKVSPALGAVIITKPYSDADLAAAIRRLGLI
jgi:DNA-binding response OmpR family regulator